MFIDQARIRLKAGDGGRGCVSFRREKFVPRGGPDGGDGGNGGSIYLVSDEHVNSLVKYRFNPFFRAENGRHGQGKNKRGRDGEDLYLKVPVGTVVKDPETGRVLFDFTEPGQVFLAARGGRGGRGNAAFATPTNQAPRYAEEGEKGEEKEYILELKTIADVGIVGFPNAGKSTLIRRVSAAKPKVADWPFTTLNPHPGVVVLDDERSFIMADIPGIIEGAHRGAGLGLKFLKHIERTKVLLFLLDVSGVEGRDPVKDYYTLKKELASYSEELARRRKVIAGNKIDLIPPEKRDFSALEELARKEGCEFFPISALTGEGVRPLLERLYQILQEEK